MENPHSLACLIVPHLETYLSCNTSTRFLLLEYPPEHLATVLALQQLVGTDVLKVAGILDVEATPSSPASSPLDSPSSSIHHTTIDTTSLPGSPSTPQGSTSCRRRHSFSRADYVLVSPATDADIATFISTIWKVLIHIDPFYSPEQPHPFAARSPLVSKFAISPPLPPPPPPPPSHVRDDSPSRISVKSSSSGRTRHVMAAATAAAIMQQQQPPPPQQQAQQPRSLNNNNNNNNNNRGVMRRGRSADNGGYGAEEESVGAVGGGALEEHEVEAYDAEERRLMPMYMRQSEMRKGNSRKALKWLGLA